MKTLKSILMLPFYFAYAIVYTVLMMTWCMLICWDGNKNYPAWKNNLIGIVIKLVLFSPYIYFSFKTNF